ncbi:MAG: hypothetical protein R3B70_29845 [Polyangiaceae bacterium]
MVAVGGRRFAEYPVYTLMVPSFAKTSNEEGASPLDPWAMIRAKLSR